ncbi:FecR protein [Botrimarina colliarenosi]|uniref:FecR protein n=1 Tax=Botrimarina colliarenosi TaxID=2528001 RepID=A0A5C6AEJ3_9BACT|nr:FecR domain-containing protein [Botrimarina colliarenosi]TWT97850.1 FecR protein [Botrimarina colliarenosi]
MKSPIELLNAHFDGRVLTAEEARVLSQWAATDPANARTVVELGIIHSQVDYRLSVARFIDEIGDSEDPAIQRSIESAMESIEIGSYRDKSLPLATVVSKPKRQSERLRGWVTAAVAASLLFAFVSVLRSSTTDQDASPEVAAATPEGQSSPQEAPLAAVVATVTEAIGVESTGVAPFRRGKYVRGGEALELKEGVLALTTADGSEVVVEGPASLVFEDGQRIALKAGRLSARVDEEATGLVVTTPTATVVDLGTEFGVGIGPHLETSVAVYDGVVELYGASSDGLANSPSKRITAGRAGQVNADGTLNWAVQTLPNDREFIRPDEIASLRKARAGSAEARQQTSFYALQRTRGLVAFQSFDLPSDGSAYSVSFRGSPPRTTASPTLVDDLQAKHLYSSGALRVGEAENAFLDIDNSSDAPFARAKLLTDRGLVGRSGAELWLAWKTRVIDPERIGDHAGLSLMFGDQSRTQEPLFIGYSGGRGLLGIVSNVGSRAVELELDANPETFAVDPVGLDDRTHQWVLQLIFGERGDKIAVWCDVPLDAIRETRPQAETVNANVMFDRLRMGVSAGASDWVFDDFVMATSIDAISDVDRLQSDDAAGAR